MRASEVMGLIASGGIKPEAEIAVELGFPPLKLTVKLKAGDVQKLMLDTKTVSGVLRRCFEQRRIFRATNSEGDRGYCIKSSEEIVDELRRVQNTVSGVGANAALSELLARWENISVDARQELQEGNRQLSDILRKYRARSLPIVDALIAMLPPDAQTRRNAEEKVRETRQSLPGPDLARISDAWRLRDTM